MYGAGWLASWLANKHTVKINSSNSLFYTLLSQHGQTMVDQLPDKNG
jgi:hypothetical protein